MTPYTRADGHEVDAPSKGRRTGTCGKHQTVPTTSPICQPSPSRATTFGLRDRTGDNSQTPGVEDRLRLTEMTITDGSLIATYHTPATHVDDDDRSHDDDVCTVIPRRNTASEHCALVPDPYRNPRRCGAVVLLQPVDLTLLRWTSRAQIASSDGAPWSLPRSDSRRRDGEHPRQATCARDPTSSRCR